VLPIALVTEDLLPQGHEWRGVLAQAAPLPGGEAVPEGYTEREYRAVRFVRSVCPSHVVGIVDACAGPLLAHADGVVECYGCDEPEASRHYAGFLVSCEPSMRFGRGHRCVRCGDEE